MTKLFIAALLLATSSVLTAQQATSANSAIQRVEVAATYTASHANVTDGTGFWSQGGSADVGVVLAHNFSAVANLNGSHTGMAGSSHAPVSLLTFTFGPRYSWTPSRMAKQKHPVDIFGQALFGVAHEFDSPLPNSASSASAFALQLGGGLNIGVTHAFAVRAIEADWVRTELPNATTGAQNSLRLSTGLVYRF